MICALRKWHACVWEFNIELDGPYHCLLIYISNSNYDTSNDKHVKTPKCISYIIYMGWGERRVNMRLNHDVQAYGTCKDLSCFRHPSTRSPTFLVLSKTLSTPLRSYQLPYYNHSSSFPEHSTPFFRPTPGWGSPFISQQCLLLPRYTRPSSDLTHTIWTN